MFWVADIIQKLSYYKQIDSCLSGPLIGRTKKDQNLNKKQEYIDNYNPVEVKKGVSLAKRKHGTRLI